MQSEIAGISDMREGVWGDDADAVDIEKITDEVKSATRDAWKSSIEAFQAVKRWFLSNV